MNEQKKFEIRCGLHDHPDYNYSYYNYGYNDGYKNGYIDGRAELEKWAVDNFNWDTASPEDAVKARKLHKKYYPENY